MSNEITGFLAEARKKLSDLNGISGQKERAMAPFVRDKLLEFCDQDAEFAQAVARANLPEWCGRKIGTMAEFKKIVSA